MAMALAGQPGIETLAGDDNKRRLLEAERNLFNEYHMDAYVSEELCDLQKLVRFKCIYSWLPPLIVWHRELIETREESRMHVLARQEVHLRCIKYCLQLIERIFFSLSELLLAQEDGYGGAWKVEEQCPIPPVTKRFLPYRMGETDELAITPRDDEHAEALAAPHRDPNDSSDPDTENPGGMMSQSMADGGMQSMQRVSFAADSAGGSHSENPTASGFMSANRMSGSMSFHSGAKRMDRKHVRAKNMQKLAAQKEKEDAKEKS